jgi:FkbM family methyltransferase
VINFAAVSRSSPVGRALRLPLKILPRGLVLPVLQGELIGKLWVPQSSVPGCWLGYYEHRKQRRFAEAIKPGHVVFDVGANVGFYTLLAASRCASNGHVVAFEPLPSNVAFLQRHLKLNRVCNTTVVEAAVADFAGTAGFVEIHDRASEGRLAPGGLRTVRVMSLDSAWREGTLPPPDVLKIDVEGGELDVLKGAVELLRTRRPQIFLATHGRELHDACCRLLTDVNYLLEPIGPPGTSVDATDELIAT